MARKKEESQDDRRSHEPEDDGSKLPAEQENGERTRSRPTFRPRCDIIEKEEGLVILADMPGASAESLHVNLERRELSIHAGVEDHAPGDMSLLSREYQVGDYERRFHLSGDVDVDKIEAKLKDGVLTLKIPRAPQPEARQIEVSTG